MTSFSGEEVTLSVVTATHDAAEYLGRSVRSVAEQTMPVAEHIIVDDGSTDETAAVVEGLQSRFPHLVYIHQRQQGSAAARNRGIHEATGRYVAFLDADDWWRPEKVEHQVEFMRRTAVTFTYGDYEKHDGETGAFVARYSLPESVGHADFLDGCPVGCLTVAYDQVALGKRYMPDVPRGQDWGLWLALTRDGTRAWRYPGNDAVYCDHRGSLSAAKLRKVWDVYRIYRGEEGLGLVASLRHLRRHVFSSLRKA
jgi:teichuronic acid biosynthesis glycosyltransferase TuaG